ncbi:hypothetical protein KTE49_22850 [Burkholderia multivorans]|uniref:hypothetical protein n=1 Tax=Burkholderia multivorans TaxID=87883 RepID=UPI000CFFF292|nr:hypothetical protein [Burkholderia multivorans]MBJ9617725.1 hypothetical protein [Burkholderia multivorans]MBU9331444.1 hypothetical protein [Burkholderia multivorans]MBU9533278.1 hypothetical protein [Burkholderia multivorans]PRF07210.1 hypothetical protein C6Q01_18085 [Burkholderia multivorans]PRF92011.1 hypothetical protein C6Q23_08290 [Burkholderia multivorans]
MSVFKAMEEARIQEELKRQAREQAEQSDGRARYDIYKNGISTQLARIDELLEDEVRGAREMGGQGRIDRVDGVAVMEVVRRLWLSFPARHGRFVKYEFAIEIAARENESVRIRALEKVGEAAPREMDSRLREDIGPIDHPDLNARIQRKLSEIIQAARRLFDTMR